MKHLLIVWYSMTGGSAQMAEAVGRGARTEPAVRTVSRRASEAGADDLLGSDAYVFVTPENLASMAGAMKDFFDRTYYAALGRIEGRRYATLVCAGSDGSGAVRQIARICTGWRLQPAAEPIVVCTHAQTPEAILAPKHVPAPDLARCEELGAALAAGLAIGVF